MTIGNSMKLAWSEDGPFGRPRELSTKADDTLTTPLLPGVEIALSRVFKM